MVLPVAAVLKTNLNDAGDADNVIGVTGTYNAHDLVRRTDRATVAQGCGLSGTVRSKSIAIVKSLETGAKRKVLHSGGTRVSVLVSAVGPRCSRSSRQQADAKATVATSGHRDSNVIHADTGTSGDNSGNNSSRGQRTNVRPLQMSAV